MVLTIARTEMDSNFNHLDAARRSITQVTSMPTTIVLPGDRRIWLKIVQGTVIDASEPSVPVVHQGKERRQLVENAAIIHSGRLHSEIVSVHKIWLREADGQESAYDLNNFPVDARPGQSLALIFGAAEGVEEGALFGAMNSGTGKFAFDESIHSDRLSPLGLYLTPRFYRARMKRGLVVGAIVGLLCSLFNGMNMSFVVAGVILGFALSLSVALVQAVIKQLQGQRLVPKLNLLALAVLLSAS